MKALGSAALVITFITGVWLIDDRYVDAKEQQTMKQQIYLRIDTYEYRELTKQYYELKKLVRENPDSEELVEQLEEVKLERAELKERIDNMLDNGE
jgi:ubiquinone/menaquinone biosynthesis C-methylase UbiE|tara:strand:+ start:2819 stop:3106 length:288 start_codon:yes stop_codon:yes gene_type:complete